MTFIWNLALLWYHRFLWYHSNLKLLWYPSPSHWHSHLVYDHRPNPFPTWKPIENDTLSAKWSLHIWNWLWTWKCSCRLYTGTLTRRPGVFSVPTSEHWSGTPTRYSIVGIYYVYTMYIPRGGIYLVYPRYVQWISKFYYHGFMGAVSQSNDWGYFNVEARND
jgi:hypothetical protein